MTMDEDLHNRASNFTVPHSQPAGMRIPEYVFAQLIGYMLQNIRQSLSTSKLIEELFAFTSEATIKQVKSYLLTHQNMQITVNWGNREDVHLPLIAVINQGENEDEGNAFLGDAVGLQEFGMHGDTRVSVREAKAVPFRQVTNIYIASQDDELTMYLYTLVKFIILSNKDALAKFYDIQALTLSGRALEYDEQKHPTHAYYRMLQLNYSTLFDWNLSEEAAKIVSLALLVQTGTQPLVTQVSPTQE